MKNPRTTTRLILKCIRGGPRPSGLTPDLMSKAHEALRCLTSFHSTILSLHYGDGYSIQKIAAYFKMPYESAKQALGIALDAFEKELLRAGLIAAHQQPPAKAKKINSASFPCPQCNAKLEKPKNPSMLFIIHCSACGAELRILSNAGDVLLIGSVNVPGQTVAGPEKDLTLADSFELLGVSPLPRPLPLAPLVAGVMP